jgi:hypothetical protein
MQMMMESTIKNRLIDQIANQITAIAPTIRISFPDFQDKSTWRIDFKPEATPQQRVAAQQVIDQFDLAWESREEANPQTWVNLAKQRIQQALIDNPQAPNVTKAEWMDLLVVCGIITYERHRDGSINWKPL